MTLPFRFGLNDHDLLYASAADQARVAADLKTLGATIHRCDLIIDAPITAPIASWAAIMRAAGIQPMIVVTWSSLPSNAATVLAGLTAANPGIWWEYGNEWEAQEGGPSQARADAYVTSFAQVVRAMKTADPTCLISPNPVANINTGGWGWVWTQLTLQGGLGILPYDQHNFHAYSYPNNLPYPNAYLDFSTFINQAIAWGVKVPFGLSECGWQSSGNGMTLALQASQMVAFLEQAIPSNLPVVIAYELSDGGGETYGWYSTVGTDYYNTPKPVFPAVQALLNATPPNYQQLYVAERAEYQVAITHVKNRMAAWQTEAASIQSWLTMNPNTHGRAEVSAILGWLNNQISIEQTWLAKEPTT